MTVPNLPFLIQHFRCTQNIVIKKLWISGTANHQDLFLGARTESFSLCLTPKQQSNIIYFSHQPHVTEDNPEAGPAWKKVFGSRYEIGGVVAEREDHFQKITKRRQVWPYLCEKITLVFNRALVKYEF